MPLPDNSQKPSASGRFADDSKLPHLVFVLGIIGLSLLACIPLFSGKFMHTHETMSPLIRLASVYKFFGDGQILVRWVPDLSRGYGLPLFNFYPPLFYYIALMFAFAGFGFVSAMNYALALLWVSSGLSMYLFTKEFFGKYGGFIAAIAYVFIPYHIVDVYVRGAVAEFTAFPLFPLILWSLYKQSQKNNFTYTALTALTYGLLLLSHNIMALIFTPVMLAYIVFLQWSTREKKLNTLFLNGGGFVLGMMLAAFFWLPAIVEKKYAQVSALLTGYLDYHNHFARLDQLIYSPWGYGLSVPGRQDTMSFQVGTVHLVLSIASLFLIRKVLQKSKVSGTHMIFFLSLVPIILFFISENSLFLWENLPLLKFVQFSWRFLSLIILIVSFLCGSLFFVIKKDRVQKTVFVLTTILLVSVNFPFCKPLVYYEQINDNLDLPLAHINDMKISAFAHYFSDFTPVWAKEAPRYPAPQQLKVADGQATVVFNDHKATRHQFIVQAQTDATLHFHMFYFPGWEVYVNGKRVAINLNHPNGLIEFRVPPGNNQVKIEWHHTPLRATAILISLFALIIISILLVASAVQRLENYNKTHLARDPPREIMHDLRPEDSPSAWIAPLLIFFGTFLVYWITLCPTIYAGDSGEIVAAASVLGVAHPTGFPLYMLLGKLFSVIIPFGDVAYRINLLTALCTSLTLLVLYCCLRKIIQHHWVCVAAVFSYAFSATLWSHATAARVYTLASLFMAIGVYCIIQWQIHRNDKYLYGYAVALALGLASHVTMILTVPMALALIALTDYKTFLRPVFYKALGCAILLSGLLHLYIPWAALRDPVVNWGHPVDWDSFLYYITQKEYSFKIVARTLRSALRVFFSTLKLYTLEFTPLGLLFIIYGFVHAWTRHKKILIATSCVVVSNMILMINYGNEEDLFTLFRYLFPSYVIMAVWVGLGLNAAYEFARSKTGKPVLAALIIFILPVSCLLAHAYQNNRSRNFIILDYARNILDSLPPNALLFTVGDAVSGPIQYLQAANGERNDIVHIDRELLSRDWFGEYLLRHHPDITPEHIVSIPPEQRLLYIITANISDRPIFATFMLLNDFENTPYGLVYKITPKDTLPDFSQTKSINDQYWDQYARRGLLDNSVYKDYMVKEIVEAYGKSKNNLAIYYSNHGSIQEAIDEYEQAVLYKPENFAALFNLSQLLRQTGEAERANALFAQAWQINPDFFIQSTPLSGNSQEKQFAVQTRATDSNGNLAETHRQSGIQFGTIGNHEKAVEEFKKAVEYAPDDATLQVLLGTAYMNTFNADAAIDTYNKAIALDPGEASATAYLNLGSIYANVKKDYPAALRNLQLYIPFAPADHPHTLQIQNNIEQLKQILNINILP